MGKAYRVQAYGMGLSGEKEKGSQKRRNGDNLASPIQAGVASPVTSFGHGRYDDAVHRQAGTSAMPEFILYSQQASLGYSPPSRHSLIVTFLERRISSGGFSAYGGDLCY